MSQAILARPVFSAMNERAFEKKTPHSTGAAFRFIARWSIS